jgi:hypothetical protein
VRTREKRKAKLDDARHDIELRKVMWVGVKVEIDMNYLEPGYVLVGG